jgi:zinc protease
MTLADVAARHLAPERAGLVAYRPQAAPPFADGAEAMRAQLDAERPPALAPSPRPLMPTPMPGARAWHFEREAYGVHVYRTSAGLPVLVQRRAGTIAHLGWFVRGGANEETPENAGITSLMARTALKGTARRSATRIAEDAEFLGGVLSAAANADGFQWTISVPLRRLDEAAELLADVVQRPSFPLDAFESERAVALANLASVRDDMYRWPVRLATEAAFGAHPYGQSPLGTEQSLARLDPAALRAWHSAHALEAPGVLVFVADAPPEDVVAVATRYLGALRPGAGTDIAVPAWPSALARHEDERDKAQSALAIMFPGPSRDDPARTAMALIAGVTSGLGGRFFDELREKQSLAYTVMASPIVRRRAGTFMAYIAMSPEKEDQARNGLLAEFAKLREQPVTARELDQAKTYALGSWAIRRESAANVMGDIADSWLFGTSLAELAEYESRVRAVTAEDMQRLALQYFDPARRVEGVVRGRKKTV